MEWVHLLGTDDPAVPRPIAVADYFSSKQLLLFTFTEKFVCARSHVARLALWTSGLRKHMTLNQCLINVADVGPTLLVLNTYLTHDISITFIDIVYPEWVCDDCIIVQDLAIHYWVEYILCNKNFSGYLLRKQSWKKHPKTPKNHRSRKYKNSRWPPKSFFE